MTDGICSTLASKIPLGEVTPNIGTLFIRNRARLNDRMAFGERSDGGYRFRTWGELTNDLYRFSAFLRETGFVAGDRVAFLTPNGYRRLVCEMAVMSGAMVAVTIFAGYPGKMISDLMDLCKVKCLIAENESSIGQLHPSSLPPFIIILNSTTGNSFDGKTKTCFYEEIFRYPTPTPGHCLTAENIFRQVTPSTPALVMFTSGTSGLPKAVQLTHYNLMSQQRALEILWKPRPGMRFLCYLPWHHSFGGLFERFFALHSGGCLAIDDSWGKNVERLLENFEQIRPNVYFSVPKVYQEIITRVLSSKRAERIFFNGELRFVFTAAAPLPAGISDVFKAKGVPVVEGWGLTETSPCCTLTDLSLERMPGVVGFPIPAVELKLAEENEICVRGPNVMVGYLNQPEATGEVLDPSGWLKTGDIGEFTAHGLKILSRKDRMFKLSNGEKVFPAVIEERIRSHCKYVKFAYVFGNGRIQPYLLVFPNRELFNRELFSAGGICSHDKTYCEFPGCDGELAKCLKTCLGRINETTRMSHEKISCAVIAPGEPSIENGGLTPTFKLVPSAIQKHFDAYIQALQDNKPANIPTAGYWVELPTQKVKT